jgi:hypothetical protein
MRTCKLGATVCSRGRTGDIAIDIRDSPWVPKDKGAARVENHLAIGETAE